MARPVPRPAARTARADSPPRRRPASSGPTRYSSSPCSVPGAIPVSRPHPAPCVTGASPSTFNRQPNSRNAYGESRPHPGQEAKYPRQRDLRPANGRLAAGEPEVTGAVRCRYVPGRGSHGLRAGPMRIAEKRRLGGVGPARQALYRRARGGQGRPGCAVVGGHIAADPPAAAARARAAYSPAPQAGQDSSMPGPHRTAGRTIRPGRAAGCRIPAHSCLRPCAEISAS